MLGAIIGDIVGSRFEWANYKGKDFKLFEEDCKPTDDSIMTLAVAKAILESNNDVDTLSKNAILCMQELGRKYPHAGYGGSFRNWLVEEKPEPYYSWGNGAAMRVSPCGDAAKTLDEVKLMSKKVTEVTHNHREGIKGAEATAVCIFLARNGKSKDEIRTYVNKNYYELDFTLDEIREEYSFDVSCQGSVPQAIAAFLESTDFEDAIRNAVSIGGDSDTIAAITGSISEAFYGIPKNTRENALVFIDNDLVRIVETFEKRYLE